MHTGIYLEEKFVGPWENFYVCEDFKCREVVLAMRERIRAINGFDALDAVYFDGKYYLCGEGNHRSSAHYLERAPLLLNIVDEDGHMFFDTSDYFPITEVTLVGIDPSDEQDRRRMIDALSYFPREEALRFCRENNLHLDDFYGFSKNSLDRIRGS